MGVTFAAAVDQIGAALLAMDAKLEFMLGSPGGPSIINYVARALVAPIDWKLPMADVFAMPHVGSRNRGTEVEKGTAAERRRPPLRAMGHQAPMPSPCRAVTPALRWTQRAWRARSIRSVRGDCQRGIGGEWLWERVSEL